MRLETIFKTYGAHDYMDISSGFIYKLSELDKSNSFDETVDVKVTYTNGRAYGYATMENPYYKEFKLIDNVDEARDLLKSLFESTSTDTRNNIIGFVNKDVNNINIIDIDNIEWYLMFSDGAYSSSITTLYVSSEKGRYKITVDKFKWTYMWGCKDSDDKWLEIEDRWLYKE